MAKSNKQKLSYLHMPLPKGRKKYKTVRVNWTGLNKRQIVDTGSFSRMVNVSTEESPYLVPSQAHNRWTHNNYGDGREPIGLFGFADFLVVLYFEDSVPDTLFIDYIKGVNTVYTSSVPTTITDPTVQRSVVQFNVYDDVTDPVSSGYTKKLLIFPDKKSFDFDVTADDFVISDMDVTVDSYSNDTEPHLPPDSADKSHYYYNEATGKMYAYNTSTNAWEVTVAPAFPDINYAVVHQSRLFGVGADRVYASGFNDYCNWNMDNAVESSTANAWCSPTQSNTRSVGDFTGIASYLGHVICFKDGFMHEIYNTKNPFRVNDVFAEGAIDARSIQEVDGSLIFVSGDGVKVYTGGNPKLIDYNLNVNRYKEAVAGTDGRFYYLNCLTDADDGYHFFIYDTLLGLWSEDYIDYKVVQFAHNENGMFYLGDDGKIYRLRTGGYTDRDWEVETEIITGGSVDIKHVKKIQMLAEIEEGATLSIYAMYDGEAFDGVTPAESIFSSNTQYGIVPIRFVPRKSANYAMKLHITGNGYVKLYQMELITTAGGELFE